MRARDIQQFGYEPAQRIGLICSEIVPAKPELGAAPEVDHMPLAIQPHAVMAGNSFLDQAQEALQVFCALIGGVVALALFFFRVPPSRGQVPRALS